MMPVHNSSNSPRTASSMQEESGVVIRRRPRVQLTVKDFGRLSLQDRSLTVNTISETMPPPQKMSVAKIRFTQATVSPYFTDGSKVADLAQQLAKGEIAAEDIPFIRVVRHQGQIWSIDNRRLRAFKDGLIDIIPVTLVDLKDPGIKKEFWDKKSSKSLEGGTIRSESTASSSKQHFEEGIYVFNKRVLNWTFEQIHQPMPSYQKTALAESYIFRDEYYESFEPLIFEEARAILQAGLKEAALKEKHPFQFSLIRLRIPKTAENPTEMKFSLLPGSERDVKAGDVLLLEHAENPELRLIAMASYSPLDQGSSELSFKVVASQELTYNFSSAFEAGQPWRAKPLGSLITLQRMYDACTSFSGRKLKEVEASILFGESLSPDDLKDADVSEHDLSKLNPSQKDAVESFLKIDKGIFLIQGPPGTGKTTTIVQLLGALLARNERVLVCAPSNKAVHILAERFMSEFPHVPVILVGVEQKLPSGSPLYQIFMDLWGQQQIDFLMQKSELLWKMQPHKLIEGDAKQLNFRIKRACQKLERLYHDFSAFAEAVEKYNLSCLKGLPLELAELLTAVRTYSDFIVSQETSAWEEAIEYYAQTEERKMPEWISQARLSLSAIAIILSTVQEKLSKAQTDGSSSGLEAELLSHSQIIFATLSVSGQQRLKTIGPIDTLIVDEAGQSVEAETLIPMRTTPSKCLLIGDIQQLPATVISQDAEKLKFGRSLMERLIVDCKQHAWMLKTQYRMHPEISLWPSQKYYQGALENHSSVSDPERVIQSMKNSPPFLSPYSFININGKEAKGPHGRSFFNATEVSSTALIVNYLAQECRIQVEEQVAIISFYAAQVERIYAALKAKYPKIKVNTVDGFQGGENDIVIISCVRANREKQIGFLKQSNRLNVALTRARFSLIILGNQPTLMNSDISELVADAQKRNFLFQEDVLQSLVRKEIKVQRTQAPQFSGQRSIIKSDYKTQICRYYALSSCRQGDRCHYAHGKEDLRLAPGRFSSQSSSRRSKK